MKTSALIPALVSVLLSACAAGPDYQRPTVDTPAAFKELGDWKPAEPREPAADRWFWPGGGVRVPGGPLLVFLSELRATPGEGFGPCGKGYFRLTAFGDAERTKEAAARIKNALAAL